MKHLLHHAWRIIALILLLIFAWFVWPTPYRYDQYKFFLYDTPIRINRFTDEVEILSSGKWIKEGVSSEPKENKTKHLSVWKTQQQRAELYDFLRANNVSVPDRDTYDKILDNPQERREFYSYLLSKNVKLPNYEAFDVELAPK